MIPTTSTVYESSDKTKLNWVMHIVKAIEKESSSDWSYFGTTTVTTTYTPLYSVQYGKIDLSAQKSTDFKTLGEDENRKYYLFPSNNVLSTDKYLYFFSETTKGDKLLVSRLNRD